MDRQEEQWRNNRNSLFSWTKRNVFRGLWIPTTKRVLFVLEKATFLSVETVVDSLSVWAVLAKRGSNCSMVVVFVKKEAKRRRRRVDYSVVLKLREMCNVDFPQSTTSLFLIPLPFLISTPHHTTPPQVSSLLWGKLVFLSLQSTPISFLPSSSGGLKPLLRFQI